MRRLATILISAFASLGLVMFGGSTALASETTAQSVAAHVAPASVAAPAEVEPAIDWGEVIRTFHDQGSCNAVRVVYESVRPDLPKLKCIKGDNGLWHLVRR